jgi:FkbM family methyltransferase
MIKKIIGKAIAIFGYKIVPNKNREDIAFEDQKLLSHSKSKKIIFDVGAYHGETVIRYHKLFEGNCSIYAFEPFPDTYAILEKKIATYSNVESFNVGLSNKDGQSIFYSNKFAATNSLLSTSIKAQATWGSDITETQEVVTISVTRLDSFIKQQGIAEVSILKMDTQGSEYIVLQGAEESIRSGKIKMIYTEIIVGPTYEGQKELDEVLRVFRSYGFELFNLYPAISAGKRLKYLDAIFRFKD